MPDADVHDIERLCVQVLSKLQELVETESVGCRIAPIGIHVTWTAFNRTDCSLPMVSVLWSAIAFHIATSREAHEGRFQSLQLLGKVDATAILSTLEGRRKEADHIKECCAWLLQLEIEDRLRVGCLRNNRCLYLLPAFLKLLTDDCFAQEFSVFALERGLEGSNLAKRLDPERQLILCPCNSIDAPEAFVADAAIWS